MTSGQRLSGFGTGETPVDSYTPDVVDISDSNTHCGTKHSVSEFGDSLHAIVVPQAPLRTCSSTSSLEDKYR